jgi:hypothetical protein
MDSMTRRPLRMLLLLMPVAAFEQARADETVQRPLP